MDSIRLRVDVDVVVVVVVVVLKCVSLSYVGCMIFTLQCLVAHFCVCVIQCSLLRRLQFVLLLCGVAVLFWCVCVCVCVLFFVFCDFC